MKYKVGDKVKYDSGDWWFYGTVTAVIENAICPCYRLNVDRMVKKNCKFSITQFEFELEADNEVENYMDKRKWENSEIEYLKKYFGVQNNENLSEAIKPEPEPMPEPEPEPMPEPEPEKMQKKKQEPEQEKAESPQIPTSETPKRKKSNAWNTNFELFRKGERSNKIYTWIAQNRRQYKTGKLKEDKFEKLMEINFPFDAAKKYAAKKVTIRPISGGN